MKDTSPHGIAPIPAKQARSRDTVDRIERAARELLQETSWADLTMAELGKRSKTHIGSIYARFENKAALLDHLDELYCMEVIGLSTELDQQIDECSLDEALKVFVTGLAKYHQKNSGLIRTLILETRTADHSAFHARSERMNDALGGFGKRFIQIAAKDGQKIQPKKMGWALFLVLSSVREAVLFTQGVPRPSSKLSSQVVEIVEMALGYLERGKG